MTRTAQYLSDAEIKALKISELWLEIASACRVAARAVKIGEAKDVEYTARQARLCIEENLRKVEELSE